MEMSHYQKDYKIQLTNLSLNGKMTAITVIDLIILWPMDQTF